MQSIPGHVIGPGHHSIVLGPDDKTEYLAYHAWDMEMEPVRKIVFWVITGEKEL